MQSQNLFDDFRQYELKKITDNKIQIVSNQSSADQDDLMLYKRIINLLLIEWKVKLNIHEK